MDNERFGRSELFFPFLKFQTAIFTSLAKEVVFGSVG